MSRKRESNQQTTDEPLKTKDERIAELEKQLAQALALIEKLYQEVDELKRARNKLQPPSSAAFCENNSREN